MFFLWKGHCQVVVDKFKSNIYVESNIIRKAELHLVASRLNNIIKNEQSQRKDYGMEG